MEANADTIAEDGTVTNTTIGGADPADPAPLLLLEQAAVPEPVATFVSGLWPDPDVIKTAENTGGVNDGGFGFFFGGEAAIAKVPELALASALSGGTYEPTSATDLAPEVDAEKIFYTAADFSAAVSAEGGGADAQGASAPGSKVCAYRDALVGARWLALYDDFAAGDAAFLSAQAVDYQDATAGAFAIHGSRFQCVAAAGIAGGDLVAIGLSGHASAPVPMLLEGDTTRVSTTTAGSDDAGTVSGGDVTQEQTGGGSAQATHTYAGSITVTVAGTPTTTDFELTLVFTRTDAGQPVVGDTADSLTFEGTLELPALEVELTLVGESATTGSPLRLAGMYEIDTRRGGLAATVEGSGGTFKLTGLVIDGHF